jgi:hypothetical protein
VRGGSALTAGIMLVPQGVGTLLSRNLAGRQTDKLGTVKSATGGRHFMAWANSREHALDLVEAALTATETVQGSVVGPLMRLPTDVMKPGVYPDDLYSWLHGRVRTQVGASLGT